MNRIVLFLSVLAIAAGCTQPPPIQDTGKKKTQKPFFEDFTGDQVDGSVWRVATWKEHGGQTGTKRCYVKDGCLNMIFINDPVNGFLSSAIESRKEFLFGKWEVRLKASSVKGVLNSFYTIDWDDPSTPASGSDGSKQEIDIELLTKSFGTGTGRVHTAVHETGSATYNSNPDHLLNFNPSEDFHVWGFEITRKQIRWFVDGKTFHTYVYGQNAITIDQPYQIKMNFWSQNGSTTWIAGPPPAGVECLYLIDWIRFTPAE